jgi:hypothetical protein
MVAAGGLYLVDNGFTPQPLLYGLAGVGAIDKASHFALTGKEALFGRADMSFLYFATNDSKLAHDTHTENRWHTLGVIVAVLAALGSAYFFIILWSYHYGAATFKAWPLSWNVPGKFDQTATFMNASCAAQTRGPTAGIAAGIAIALFLVYMNRTYLWWRLSPFGFVVASSWNISNQIWTSVFRRLADRRARAPLGRPARVPLASPPVPGPDRRRRLHRCLMAVLEIVIGVKGGS